MVAVDRMLGNEPSKICAPATSVQIKQKAPSCTVFRREAEGSSPVSAPCGGIDDEAESGGGTEGGGGDSDREWLPETRDATPEGGSTEP